MPTYVVVQPSGQYATFSTVVDDFTAYDMTREECAELLLEHRVEEAKREIEKGIQRAEQETAIRYQKSIATVSFHHGEAIAKTRREESHDVG